MGAIRRPAGPVTSQGSRAPRIALWGNFGSGNLGNEATLQALVCNVRRLLPQASLTAVCSVPEDTRFRHGLPAVEISPTRQRTAARQTPRLALLARLICEGAGWTRACRTARGLDALLVAGTGVLTDDGEGPLGLLHDLLKWSLAARAAGARTHFVSVGVERLDHPLSRFFVRSAARLADSVSLRDEPSRSALQALDCALGALVCPDLAFSLPPGFIPEWSPAERPRVAVGLYDAFARGRSGAGDAAAYRAYLAKISSLVAWLLARGQNVQVLIGDMVYDAPVLADLRECLGPRRSCGPGTLRDEPARSVEELLRQLAGVDLVVASRFHHLLLGFLLGHPAVSIAYEAKNDTLMARMGLGHCCHSIAALDVEQLQQQLASVEAAAAGLRPQILRRVAEDRAHLDRQYQELFGAPGSSPAIRPRRRGGA